MIASIQINEIVTRIAERYNPEKIILFGSYAKGNNTEESDLDLILIKETDLPKHKRGIEVRRLFYRLPVPIDFRIYTRQEFNSELNIQNSFLNSALSGSKTLYERKN